jgi:hypothetical protein
MASDVWNGTGDWSTSSDWSGGEPGAVTAAEIASGTADVSNVDFEDVFGLTVDLGATVNIEGELTIGDTTFGGNTPTSFAINGALNVDGGGLIIGGYVNQASGTITLSNGGSLQWNGGANEGGATSTGVTVDMGANAGNTSFQFSQAFDGTVENFNGSDSISYSGAVNSISIGTNSATFNTPSGNYTINFGSSVNTSDIVVSGNSISTSQPVCFTTGTLIRTTRGEVAVEDLAVGDLAVTVSGEARPIKWVGHKRVVHPTMAHLPVRVVAGAFGDNLPVRDLMLSPGHAVCVDVMDAVFVPVGELINGATIAQVEVAEVTYWHVELESHDVLLAERLPCESYMDAGNREWFGRDYGRLQAIDPERIAESLTRYARPFVNRGPLVEAIRQRLAARAEAMGWTRASDMDLHLIIDGRRIDPTIDGDLARFVLPADAPTARLVSRTFVPGADRRKLGVRIKSLAVSDGLRLSREIPVDVLSEGVHGLEHEGQRTWRWTDGDAVLPPSLWQGCNGLAILTVGFNSTVGAAWIAPQAPLAASQVRAA